jgi:hypothetical protein
MLLKVRREEGRLFESLYDASTVWNKANVNKHSSFNGSVY